MLDKINFEALLELEDNLFEIVSNKTVSNLSYNCSSYINTLSDENFDIIERIFPSKRT